MVLAPLWKTVNVEIPGKLSRSIRLQAKGAWPRETIGFLLGRRAGTLYEVEDLWTPPGISSSKVNVDLTPWHPAAAAEIAQNDELELLGAWHSHPRPWELWRGMVAENTPSTGDQRLGWEGICGICAVIEPFAGPLTTRLDFYAPNPPVSVKIVA